MRDAAAAIIPLLLFMLIPIWIPIITTTIGALYDILKGRRLAEYTP